MLVLVAALLIAIVLLVTPGLLEVIGGPPAQPSPAPHAAAGERCPRRNGGVLDGHPG